MVDNCWWQRINYLDVQLNGGPVPWDSEAMVNNLGTNPYNHGECSQLRAVGMRIEENQLAHLVTTIFWWDTSSFFGKSTDPQIRKRWELICVADFGAFWWVTIKISPRNAQFWWNYHHNWACTRAQMGVTTTCCCRRLWAPWLVTGAMNTRHYQQPVTNTDGGTSDATDTKRPQRLVTMCWEAGSSDLIIFQVEELLLRFPRSQNHNCGSRTAPLKRKSSELLGWLYIYLGLFLIHLHPVGLREPLETNTSI